jgi:hypothetical protein
MRKMLHTRIESVRCWKPDLMGEKKGKLGFGLLEGRLGEA